MKKLVLFGDSLFANFGKRYILRLEEKLPEYDVYNCAAGGWDTNDCIKKAPYISQLKPDIVILSIGTNDAAPWKQVDIKTFEGNLPKIFSLFSNSEVFFFLPPPVKESKLDLHTKELTNKVLQKYYEVAKQLCEKTGVKYLDSWSIFKPMLDNGEEYHENDGIHFIESDYNVLIEHLAKLIES